MSEMNIPATMNRGMLNLGNGGIGGSIGGGYDLSGAGAGLGVAPFIPSSSSSFASDPSTGLEIGKSVGSSILGFMANPAVGLAMGGIQLIGKGIGAWINWKNKQKAEREARVREQEAIRRQKEDMEREYAMANQRAALSWQQFLNQKSTERFNRKQTLDQQNYQRANDYINNFVNMINSDESLRQGFINRWR